MVLDKQDYMADRPPRAHALVATDTELPAPHLKSNLTNGSSKEEPDYLRLILTARVYDIIKETPLQEAINLNAKLGGTRIYLKREDLQPVFSFKIRGAYNKMANLTPEEQKAGVIACSAGKRRYISATIAYGLYNHAKHDR